MRTVRLNNPYGLNILRRVSSLPQLMLFYLPRLFFSDKGNFFQVKMSDLPVNEKTYISHFVTTTATESICNAAIYSKNEKKNIYFVTKNGLMKKTLLSEYYLKRGNSARAIALDTNDEIISIFFSIRKISFYINNSVKIKK